MHHFCLISVPYFHLFPAAMVSRASGDPGGHRSTLTKEGSIHVPSVPGRRALLTAPPPLRSTPAPAGHNNPRRSPPAPPATDTQSSPSRRCRTGRGPPAPGRTSGGRAPPGVTLAPSIPCFILLRTTLHQVVPVNGRLNGSRSAFRPLLAALQDRLHHSGFHTHRDSLTPPNRCR